LTHDANDMQSRSLTLCEEPVAKFAWYFMTKLWPRCAVASQCCMPQKGHHTSEQT